MLSWIKCVINQSIITIKSMFYEKTLLIWAIAGIGSALLAGNPPVETKVNVEKSQISWKGYKVTGQHHGKIALKDGSLTWENGMLTGGSFTMDMSTISCEDLQGEWNDKLVDISNRMTFSV